MVPEGDLSSWIWKVKIRLMRKFGIPAKNSAADDFDWTRYHLEYAAQLRSQEGGVLLRLEDGDYDWRSGQLVPLVSGVPTLHPNHHLLYQIVSDLKPTSVLELGCGGGDHLHNLAVLLPNLDIRGVDRSAEQLRTLALRNPECAPLCQVFNISEDSAASLEPADIVFTQAVIMHIQTGDAHRKALQTAFSLSRKQVVLIENWRRHDFVADIRELLALGQIAWPEVHLYVRAFALGGRTVASGLVASRHPLPWQVASRTEDLLFE
jgi:hypothetical protein